MTVEKVKKNGKLSKKTENFKFLDTLMNKIDTIESEEQVTELFDEEELLKESFKSLLTLMECKNEFDEGEDDFDCDKVDENVMEIMTKFLEEGIVNEEEFEDFFTDELVEDGDDESEGSEDYESEEESISEAEFDTSVSETSSNVTNKMTAEEKKKAKNMKELEMLMEKVEDESDFGTETEDDEEDEEDVVYESEYDQDKKDIFEDDQEQQGENRLSSFEKSQLALKSQIAALESEQLAAQKPWSLRGEINAHQRPSDSLLEEAVDFENLSRPTPLITEERTEEIEDVIRRRIGEAAWDDVERKDGRDLTLLNGMQKNTVKSSRALLEDVATADPQRSLTQVYEDEATTKLTGSTAKDQETLDKQSELTAMFAKICRHVDGLSGNRFAPKVYVQSDFQIKTLGGSKK